MAVLAFWPFGMAEGQTGTADDRSRWPYTIEADGARVTVYEPQVLSWPGRTRLTARAAVSVVPRSAAAAFLGTVDIAGDTIVDDGRREVAISHINLLATHFPTLDTARASVVEARMRDAISRLDERRVPLEMVLLSLGGGATDAGVAVSNTPPTIIVSTTPAILVTFDGAPVLAQVPGTEVERAINADATVLHDRTGSWYLREGTAWWSATGVAGPWAAAAVPPAINQATARIPSGANEARGQAATARILVSMVPAELIVTDGPPRTEAVPGTGLTRVTNTSSVLFRDGSGAFYVLLSGRWFRARDLSGPWVFATADLPEDFSRIDPDGPDGGVLASVPGTAAAQAAVLQASIPSRATLLRSGTTVKVAYAGAPQFRPIAGTTLLHVANASHAVIKAGRRYYLCANGAWFTAASPNGPWVLASSVPAEIYAIPPSSPLYPLTYVRVYAATPTTVTYGYTAGYALGFVSAGVLVYGTGYATPPVVVAGPVPAYFPYPRTYVGGVSTVSSSGAWVRGGAVYGTAYGVAGFNAYNPVTGSYARGGAEWGPYGGTANGSFTNARTGVSGSTHQNADAYGRWGSSTFSGPSQTVHTESGSNARGSAGAFSSSSGAAGVGVHGAGGSHLGVARGAGGNVYAGANGNVYRHTDSGWSKWGSGGWNPVQPSGRWGTEQAGLERDRFARMGGAAGGGWAGGRRFRGGGFRH